MLYLAIASLATLAHAYQDAALITARDVSGELSFPFASQAVAQRGGTANLFVARLGGSAGPASVLYSTSSGTAAAGVDFAAANGTLAWAFGDSSNKTVSVKLLPTAPSLDDGTFTITLDSPTGAILGDVSEVVVSLSNDYIAPATLADFDWGTWTLTLPIDQYRLADPSAKAWTIPAKDVLAGFADDFFYVSPSLNPDGVPEVVFAAPANGAVTTPGSSDGSDHTRSELRETWAGGDSKGDWTSAAGGVLQGTCRVLAVAPSTTEATFAQIHGQDFAFVLLDYRVTKQAVELAVYGTNAAGVAKKTTTVKKGVQLGDLIEYEIVFQGNTLTVTVEGANPLSVQVDQSWVDVPVYFKAGAYHAAPNNGNAQGDETVVVYRTLVVTH